MIQAINTRIPTPFYEGAGQPGCMQKLRNLVTTIKDAIVRFFQCILPCVFKKKPAAPIQASAVASVPTGQSAIPQQPVVQAVTTVTTAVLQPQARPTQRPVQPQKPATQPAVLLSQQQPAPVQATVQQTVVQPPQPAPIQQPIQPPAQPMAQPVHREPVQEQQPQAARPVEPQQPDPLNGNINNPPLVQPAPVNFQPPAIGSLRQKSLRFVEANNDDYGAAIASVNEEKKAAKPRPGEIWTQIVTEYWKMKTLDRLQFLAEKLPSTDDVRGTVILEAQRTRGACFVVYEAIDLLWEKVKEGREFTGTELDKIVRQGVTFHRFYQDENPAINHEARPLFVDILSTEFKDFLKPETVTRKKLPAVQFANTYNANQAVQILMNNAMDKGFFAAVLVAKEPVDNPPVYGVFLKYNPAHRTTNLYLVDPYGGGGNPMVFRKFGQGELTKYLLNDSGYSCMGLMKVQKK